MENFKLTNLFNIKGISAPSGLLYSQNVLFLISDSSNYLYQYDISKKLLLKFPLVKDAKENIEKVNKPDLESITQYGNQIILLGSGSTSKRNAMFTLDLSSDALQKQDMSALYEKLKTVGALTPEQLNIEGAIYAHKTMLLFQRGNAKGSKNGVFIVPNHQENGIRFVPIVLPTKKPFGDKDYHWIHYSGDEPYTRIVDFNKVTGHESKNSLITLEIPKTVSCSGAQ